MNRTLERPAPLPRLDAPLGHHAAWARHPFLGAGALLLAALLAGGCSVLAVADATVTVAATAVKAGAAMAGAAIDVTAAGVRAVTAEDEPEKPAD